MNRNAVWYLILAVPLLFYGCGSGGGGGGSDGSASLSGPGTSGGSATFSVTDPDPTVPAASITPYTDGDGGDGGDTGGGSDGGTDDGSDGGTDDGSDGGGSGGSNGGNGGGGGNGKGNANGHHNFSHVKSLFVTFDSLEAHHVELGWISLPLLTTPCVVDLLQFSGDRKTEIVPPVELPTGKYTQIRIGVAEAKIVTDTDQTIPVKVPSNSLKTSSSFEFEVKGGGSVDLVCSFVLNKSLHITGNGKYMLKPVLHLAVAREAATITGVIPPGLFGPAAEKAEIVVIWNKNENNAVDEGDEFYTCLTVRKEQTANTQFKIRWLAPSRDYIVQFWVEDDCVEQVRVRAERLPPSIQFPLANADPI